MQEQIAAIESPVARAGLILHLPALFHHHPDPPLNIVTSLRLGASRVRALPLRERSDPAEAVVLHFVAPDGRVGRTALPRADNAHLHERPLDLVYGTIPPIRYGGKKRFSQIGRQMGIMLAHDGLVLAHKLSYTAKGRPRASWLTWRPNLTLKLFPGVMAILEADRQLPPPPSTQRPLRRADVHASVLLQREATTSTIDMPWAQQIFPSLAEAPLPDLIEGPELLEGLWIYPDEVPMLLALHAGELPPRHSLPADLQAQLEVIADPSQRSRACRFICDFFIRRHMSRLRPNEAVWRRPSQLRTAPFQDDLFPRHLNLIDVAADLSSGDLEAWVSLDRITLDLAVASPELGGEYEHIRFGFKVPAGAPPVGPLRHCRIVVVDGAARRRSLVIELQRKGTTLARWTTRRGGWYHPLDRYWTSA
jgi:hypothetical protein